MEVGTGVGLEVDASVGTTTEAEAVAVGIDATSVGWVVGPTAAGAVLEQPSTAMLISTAGILSSFIFCLLLTRNYLPISVNHNSTAFLKLPGVLNQQP